MESRINKKIAFYVNDMKEGIVGQMKIMRDSTLDVESQYDSIISYIINYKTLSLQKEDFNKRKRNKNVVNDCENVRQREVMVNNVVGVVVMVLTFVGLIVKELHMVWLVMRIML